MKTSNELMKALEKSSENGFSSLELLEYIENLIRVLAEDKKVKWMLDAETVLRMVDHVEKMYDERLTVRLIDVFERGKYLDTLEQHLHDSIGCGFTNFINKEKRKEK